MDADPAAGDPDDPDVPVEQRLSRLEGAVEGLVSSHRDLKDAVTQMLDRMGHVELQGVVQLDDVSIRGRATGRCGGRGHVTGLGGIAADE